MIKANLLMEVENLDILEDILGITDYFRDLPRPKTVQKMSDSEAKVASLEKIVDSLNAEKNVIEDCQKMALSKVKSLQKEVVAVREENQFLKVYCHRNSCKQSWSINL